MSDRYLVLFDADHIKDYVFASGRLREIRGASEQVRQLTDESTLDGVYGSWDPGSGNGTGVIYASGGGGAILVENETEAAGACRDLEAAFHAGTGSATLSAVWTRVEDSEADALECAARKLARRKASRPIAQYIPGGAVRFCSSDRLYPASSLVDDPGASEKLAVSGATGTKWRKNKELRTRLNQKQSPFWREFLQQLPEQDWQDWVDAIDPGQDFQGISAQSRPSGYLGLVYVDGDRVGKTIQAVVQKDGFAGYRRISRALTNAAIAATAGALANAYGQRKPAKSLPFDVITIGGDDILLVCTASSALRIACDLSRLFTEGIEKDLGFPITASAGVVIAHDSLPILTLERAGRELLKSAKDAGTAGAIDFHIVSSPGLERLGTIRAREYQIDEQTLLTRRPYPVKDAQELIEQARKIRGLGAGDDGIDTALPNTKIAELYRACRGDRNLATLQVLGSHARLARDQRRVLTSALHALGSDARYPFSDEDSNYQISTALIDLLEVSEFVGE